MGPVKEFFSGKTIFVTGASGFMGKVLIEKLLYSCSDLAQIFILMREKRGKSGEQRVREFSGLPLFDRIVSSKPELLDKLVPVYGDIVAKNFGLSEDHLRRVISETNVVFHMAATVNFEAPFKSAVEMNVKGVQHMIELAKQMQQLQAVLHLSTTFCSCDQEVLREEVYDSNVDPKNLIKCTEWMTDEAMNEMRKVLMAPHPNSYTYTKRLGEVLVRDEYENLPISICRPSIVLPTYKDPLAGWVDNLNGPIGVMLGAGKGVIRSMLCNGENHAEVAPVDFVINGLIVIAWHTAVTKPK
jgi:alcohol-forming fatty acyl-CoA reductase